MQLTLRHIVPTAAAVLLLGACAGESYPGIAYDLPWNDDIINNESGRSTPEGVEIETYIEFDTFRTGTPGTRATGPFIVPERSKADSNRYEKSIFHIFAFRDTLDAQGLPMPDYTKRSNDPDDRALNCLVDGNDYLQGMPARFVDRSGRTRMLREGLRTDTALYWGSRNTRIGYNFYGCFLDDYRPTQATARRDAEGIVYDVDIDGTQDLMYGMSDKLTDRVLTEQLGGDTLNLTEQERRMIVNIGNYSAYAAAHGVAPHIKLKHGLVRLHFQGLPGDRSCDSVTIEDIQVYTKYKSHMRIVDDDRKQLGITFDEDRKYLVLKDSNYTTNPDSMGILPYEALHTDGNTVSWLPSYDKMKVYYDSLRHAYDSLKANYFPVPEDLEDIIQRLNKEGGAIPDDSVNIVSIGGDLLVAPDTVYRMKLTYRQTLRNKNKVTGESLYDHHTAYYDLRATELQPPEAFRDGRWWFREGFVYNIRIRVYGLRPIEVSSGVEDWGQGEYLPPNEEGWETQW